MLSVRKLSFEGEETEFDTIRYQACSLYEIFVIFRVFWYEKNYFSQGISRKLPSRFSQGSVR
jgi:hypothetical protein